MTTYYKHEADSDPGAGLAYMEVEDGWVVRQAEIYSSVCRWADEAHPEGLSDQSVEAMELGPVHEVSAAEFERAWHQATSWR